MPVPAWQTIASAVPLAATEQLGLGPYRQPRRRDPARLARLASSADVRYTAVDSAGATGSRLLVVLAWYGGELDAEQLAAETPGADPDDLEAALARVVDAGLVVRIPGGGVRLDPALAGELGPIGVSMADPQAVTSDELGQVCIELGLSPVPKRKQERLDAITAVFADPDGRARVRASLSSGARQLLERIAAAAGPRPVDPMSVGLASGSLYRAATPRYAFSRDRARLPDSLVPLAELTARGIVGLAEWEDSLWIWREAWPLLERPLYPLWPSVPDPATAPVATGDHPVLPPMVALVERALQHWEQSPPAVLKSGDRRLAKGAVRSTAKALGCDEASVEVIGAAALSMGLLLANVVGAQGRGRNRRVDAAWMVDPELRAIWSAAPARVRWLRLVAEWANPAAGSSEQLVANRHLVLWELAALPDGHGWVDADHAARWIEHRYAPVGDAEAATICLAELRALGVVAPDGPAGLTPLGRLALGDPDAVADAQLGSATEAVVQADETVICPPDLDADLSARLGELAKLESDAGARIFRLDPAAITRAVQGGDTAEGVVAFLEQLSSVPLPDTVRALVADAAGRADRVRVLGAATVVVVDDPADLVAACRLKSAKLTAVSDTVAVSPLAPAKVHPILERKGLHPLLVDAGDPAAPTPRRGSENAAELARAAAHRRVMAERYGVDGMARDADLLEQLAAEARDPAAKLAVRGPLAVTPALLEAVRR